MFLPVGTLTEYGLLTCQKTDKNVLNFGSNPSKENYGAYVFTLTVILSLLTEISLAFLSDHVKMDKILIAF